MKLKTMTFAGALLLAAAAPAMAHHSFAMFANDKTITVDGTVKEFEWVNPHSWIHMTVVNATGTPEEWAFRNGLTRAAGLAWLEKGHRQGRRQDYHGCPSDEGWCAWRFADDGQAGQRHNDGRRTASSGRSGCSGRLINGTGRQGAPEIWSADAARGLGRFRAAAVCSGDLGAIRTDRSLSLAGQRARIRFSKNHQPPCKLLVPRCE